MLADISLPKPRPKNLHFGLPLVAVGAFLLLVCVALCIDSTSATHLGTAKAALPASPPPPQCGWNIVTSPSTANEYNNLMAVSALTGNDVWAVGGVGLDTPGQMSIVEHWTDGTWSIVPSPNPASQFNDLLAVDAVSSSDVWAVGYQVNQGGISETLVEHWDGTVWSYITSPNASTWQNELHAIVGLSANDVWAVGFAKFTGAQVHFDTLVEHWDGTAWHIVTSPNAGMYDDRLSALAATSPHDIWAVGNYLTADGVTHTLTEHWNGSAWVVVPSPDVPSFNSYLTSVTMVSSSDVWAVGYYCPGNCFTPALNRSLAIHWNGSSWSIVSLPVVGTVSDELDGVKAISGNDVWAAGVYMPTQTQAYGLALHWDGAAWAPVATESPAGGGALFFGIDGISHDDVWAVGQQSSPGSSLLRTLAERYTGCGSVTPSPTPPINTRTPAPASPTEAATALPSTATPSAPSPTQTSSQVSPTTTATATATAVSASTPTIMPTACAITFTDMPPGGTFTQFVVYLACHGVISGYPDGTFRPNNNITRGQLAKMVSNAAGFAGDPGPQLFEDVSPGSAFFTWINRLASQGFIGGYACGRPGEPCGAGSKPYFRPYANATRGQVSKVVSNSAGLTGEPSGQTFEDVPPGHPFYTWIERLAGRRAIGGYPCGGTGESCGPGNRPYFRPQNNVTRGQASKIVANTFYPSLPNFGLH